MVVSFRCVVTRLKAAALSPPSPTLPPSVKMKPCLEDACLDRTQQLSQMHLTEQQLAREQADKANMSKSRFIAAASHDLLQPMHAARLFSTDFRTKRTKSEEDRKTLQQLDRALHGAESMLSALLDIARLEGGTIQPNRQAYPLHDLLSDLELQFKSIAAQRGIRFSVHDAQFWIDTDPQWIRRIIQNFVSNALRYTAKGQSGGGCTPLHATSTPITFELEYGILDPGLQKNNESNYSKSLSAVAIPHRGVSKGLGLGFGHRTTDDQPARLPSVHVYSEYGKGSCFMIEVPIMWTHQKSWQRLYKRFHSKPKPIRFCAWTMTKPF